MKVPLSSARIPVALLLLAALAVSADPCVFCTRGNITTPDKPVSIPGYQVLDSCGAVQSLAPTLLTADNPQCEILQSLSSYCGCPTPEDSCSLCPDGNPAPLRDKGVPWLREQFQGIVPSCDLTEAYAASLSNGSDSCKFFQAISRHCGCESIQDHCVFCNGEPLQPEFYDVELPFLSSDGITGTCELFYEIQYQTPSDAQICGNSIHVTWQCGCNNGELVDYGTESKRQQAALAGTARAGGTISLVGSCLVMLDIFWHTQKRRSVYHQLMVLISLFDIITACLWIVGPVAVEPKYDSIGLPRRTYGAKSNEQTCTGRGYFIQLGFTSVFLCVSLAIYYLLVIVYSWRETRLKKYRLGLLGLPLVAGLGLSFAAIPYADVGWGACQFDTDQKDENLWSLLLFGVVPMLGSTTAILCILVVMYWKVLSQRRKAQRWGAPRRPSVGDGGPLSARSSLSGSMGGGDAPTRRRRRKPSTKDRLEREVLWQSTLYAFAFCLTWPILAVVELNANNFDYPYGFWVVVAIARPLQGFSNSVCYFRPICRRSRQQRRTASHSRASQQSNESGATTSSFTAFLNSHFFRRSGTESANFRPGSVQELPEVPLSRVSSVSSVADDSFLSDPTVALANLGDEEEITAERRPSVSTEEGTPESMNEKERRLSTTLSVDLEAIPEAIFEESSIMMGPESKASS